MPQGQTTTTHPDYDRCYCGIPRFQHQVDPVGSFRYHTFSRLPDVLVAESAVFESLVDRVLVSA